MFLLTKRRLRVDAPLFLFGLAALLLFRTGPDPVVHQRVLTTIETLSTGNAALQREASRAHAGPFQNENTFSDIIDGIQRSFGELGMLIRASELEITVEQERDLQAIDSVVARQQVAVEELNISNALLVADLLSLSSNLEQLSLNHDATSEVGLLSRSLVADMLRVMAQPSQATAGNFAARLSAMQETQPDTANKAVDGNAQAQSAAVLAGLSRVEAVTARLRALSISEFVGRFKNSYLEAYGHRVTQASVIRNSLIVFGALLGAYVALLVLRLRRHANGLTQRVGLETAVSGISSRFINLSEEPFQAVLDGELDVLARLLHAEYSQIICMRDEGPPVENLCSWGIRKTLPTDAIALLTRRALEDLGFERVGKKTVYLADRRVTSFVVEDMRAKEDSFGSCAAVAISTAAGLGMIMLQKKLDAQRWSDDELSVLLTAGEVFSRAIEKNRIETERRVLEQRLEQAQRLEALGRMAGGIAHEFNNILGAIQGYSEMALHALRKPTATRGYVQQISVAGARAKTIIDQILAFSRTREKRYINFPLRPAVEETIELMRITMPGTLRLVVESCCSEALVWGNPVEMQQVLINLLTNAADATKSSAEVIVSIDRLMVDIERSLSHGTLAAGSYVCLSVKDEGGGMGDATVKRIFEPFFTTKPFGSGTGLGLSMAYGTIEEHGGRIHVESQPGQGSTFTIYLPQRQEAINMPPPASSDTVPGRGERVAVFDADETFLSLCEEKIAALGYEPIGFTSGQSMRAWLSTEGSEVDLLMINEQVEDVTLSELLEAGSFAGDFPIILIVDPLDRVALERAHRHAGILEKGFSSDRLAAMLRGHLQRSMDLNPTTARN